MPQKKSIPDQLEQVLHDWYTERWNSHYADQNEPGWAHCADIVALLENLYIAITPAQLQNALHKIYKPRT